MTDVNISEVYYPLYAMTIVKNNKAVKLFRENGGMLRAAQALKLGIHPRNLYKMRNNGEIVQLSRGVYRLAEMDALNQSDLAAVAIRAPNAVICLISALSFHEITTQIPHEVYLAIPRRKESPRIDFPPTRAFHFSDDTIAAGVEVHDVGGVKVKIFSREKTVADCFKFRNRIGLDVAIEGLKMCLNQNGSRAEILEYARFCRVENIIRPYLEAID